MPQWGLLYSGAYYASINGIALRGKYALLS